MMIGVLCILAAAVWFVLEERSRGAVFRRRHDHPGLWRQAVVAEHFDRLEAALEGICYAFLIPDRYQYRLRPSDDIHWYYRLSTGGGPVDSLEYENLMLWFERQLGVHIEHLLAERPCTVGRLLRRVVTPARRPAEQT